jgi:hypothetical protein
MVKAGEVVPEIQVEHPVHLLLHDPSSERVQRAVRAAPRPEAVREAEKVLPAPRGVIRKEMKDINISSVPVGIPAPG